MLKGILKRIPGFSGLPDFDMPEKELKKIESVIKSMTPKERQETVELSHPRRKRLAKGSGTTLDDVNRLVKGFKRIKQFLKKMPKKGLAKGLLNMNKSGGNPWL